jgi:uncharacterized OsmC-like protein
MDGAPEVGGRNPRRVSMGVLMGMGGCTAIDVVSMLRKQRQDIRASRSRCRRTGRDHPKVFTSATLVYTAAAANFQPRWSSGGQLVGRKYRRHGDDQERSDRREIVLVEVKP